MVIAWQSINSDSLSHVADVPADGVGCGRSRWSRPLLGGRASEHAGAVYRLPESPPVGRGDGGHLPHPPPGAQGLRGGVAGVPHLPRDSNPGEHACGAYQGAVEG